MKKIYTAVLSLFLLFANTAAQAGKESNLCPADLVNFWKNYAADTENYSGIPVFLLTNECFRALVSTEFHTAMVNRFDDPNNEKYVSDLYAQLDWNKNTTNR